MSRNMGGHKAADEEDRDHSPAGDTEGHSLLINPGAGRDLARSRSKDIEREVKQRQREKEARGR